MEPPAIFYSLSDMNYIANGLDRVVDVTSVDVRDNEDGTRAFATFNVTGGMVIYNYESDWWFLRPSNATPDTHRQLVTAFLMALGIERGPASITATSVVERRADDRVVCLGPGRVIISSSQLENGRWSTSFTPVLDSVYFTPPSC